MNEINDNTYLGRFWVGIASVWSTQHRVLQPDYAGIFCRKLGLVEDRYFNVSPGNKSTGKRYIFLYI